ncbi:glycerate kinase [Opitutaceae bacterium TAV1]|nr:glycerate kinase [Opitutaceae bacterium TAV1]
MRVLIALDKFKHSLTAAQACDAVAAALREAQPAWSHDICPLTDGGDGFCEILTRAAGGEQVEMRVEGPRGEQVDAGFGIVSAPRLRPEIRRQLGLPGDHAGGAAEGGDGDTVALVDLARASGIVLLPPEQRDPWQASTFGAGQLLQEAMRAKPAALVLGIGGSATSDLGIGALAALGLEFTDTGGRPLSPSSCGLAPAHWEKIGGVRAPAGFRPAGWPPVFIACDVTNPLLGPDGAAAVYGPQKGLAPADIPAMDAAAARMARLLCAFAGRPLALADTPGAGAAGGTAFGLLCVAGPERARIVPGNEFVSAWLDLDARITAADLVITGEGSYDASSLSGKGPGALVARARELGKPVHVFCGRADAVTGADAGVHAITPPGMPLEQALREGAANLAQAVREVF